MDRRTFIAVGAAWLALPLVVEAQAPARVPRIGYLGNGSAHTYARRIEAFKEGLRDLGYVERNTVALEYRWAEGRQDRLPLLAADLVRRNVDIIVTHSILGARAAKQATTTIPIVMATSSDPVGNGLVGSLARPGGNVTGLSLGTGEGFAGKWLQFLKEAVPTLSSVAVLWNRANPAIEFQVKDIQSAARALGMHLQLVEFHGPDQLGSALAAMGAQHPGGLLVPNDSAMFVQRARILTFAATRHLPAIYPTRETVEAGGLMAYSPSQTDMYRRAATYVDKILKGAKPADLPIEQPTKFELVINLKTAKALGLTIPQSLLLRADEVIQ